MVVLELIGGVLGLALIFTVALYFQISNARIDWRITRRAMANARAARQRADSYLAQRYHDPSSGDR